MPLTSYSQESIQQDLYVYNRLKKRNGTFVELGAHNGVHHSNTLMLEKEFGWKGILIEANPHLYKKLRKNRPDAITVNKAIAGRFGRRRFWLGGSYSGIHDTMPRDFVKEHRKRKNKLICMDCVTLGDVLLRYDAPKEIDFLSLDVEGAEYEILENLKIHTFTFNVITVEFRYDMLLLEKLQELLRPQYELDVVQAFDAFFVRV